MVKLIRALILAFAVLALSACAPSGAYRNKSFTTCELGSTTDCSGAAITKSPEGYTLAYLEIDEQGAFQDRRQLDAIMNVVNAEKDQYVIVYIHGWHHSAAPGDSNIDSFQRRLAFTKTRYPDRKVTGIYVGWRGDSITLSGLNVATFWDRKNVSQEIGQNSLLEFLLTLEGIKKNSNDKNILLVVGHSFGGSALFNAVHQTLLQRLIQNEGKIVKGYGDLVVLVNPAIESMLLAPLVDASQVHAQKFGFDPDQPVLLMSVGSSADTAGGTLFPLGRFFSTLFEKHRKYAPPQHRPRTTEVLLDQSEMDRQTIGRFEGHLTHKLEANESAGNDLSCPFKEGWRRMAVEREARLHNSLKGEGWDTGYVNPKNRDRPPIFEDPSQMQIRHLVGKSHPYSPYWTVLTNESVIPGHNDITQKHFWCFVDVVIQDGAGPFKTNLPAPSSQTLPILPPNSRTP